MFLHIKKSCYICIYSRNINKKTGWLPNRFEKRALRGYLHTNLWVVNSTLFVCHEIKTVCAEIKIDTSKSVGYNLLVHQLFPADNTNVRRKSRVCMYIWLKFWNIFSEVNLFKILNYKGIQFILVVDSGIK